MKVGILGGGGCFALNFARVLSEKKIDHFGIGRSPPKAAPFWLVPDGYRYYTAHLVDELDLAIDILDSECPDVIVNFAAQGEGAASFGANAPDFFRTNCWGLSKLCTWLTSLPSLHRFIHIGSSEVYGSVTKPAKETDCLRPTSPYSISKAAFDQYLESLWRIHKFPMNIIRPSNCYTPGQQLHRIIPKTIIHGIAGRKLILHGGGVARKSYLHAQDLSQAILDVIDKGHLGKTYNVGPASSTAILDVVRMVCEQGDFDFDSFVEVGPDRTGQDSEYLLDCVEIAKDCYWTPTINLRRGITQMISWALQFPELLDMPTEYAHRP